jgi:hypothetical protein
MEPEHQDKLMKDVIEEFKKKFSNVLPLNIGTLLMASYILFVYPQQTEFDAIDFSQINTGKFVVHEGTSSTEKTILQSHKEWINTRTLHVKWRPN